MEERTQALHVSSTEKWEYLTVAYFVNDCQNELQTSNERLACELKRHLALEDEVESLRNRVDDTEERLRKQITQSEVLRADLVVSKAATESMSTLLSQAEKKRGEAETLRADAQRELRRLLDDREAAISSASASASRTARLEERAMRQEEIEALSKTFISFIMHSYITLHSLQPHQRKSVASTPQGLEDVVVSLSFDGLNKRSIRLAIEKVCSAYIIGNIWSQQCFCNELQIEEHPRWTKQLFGSLSPESVEEFRIEDALKSVLREAKRIPTEQPRWQSQVTDETREEPLEGVISSSIAIDSIQSEPTHRPPQIQSQSPVSRPGRRGKRAATDNGSQEKREEIPSVDVG